MKKKACDSYIDSLWKCIEKRTSFTTGLSDSPCAITEAQAEGILVQQSNYWEENLTIDNAVSLKRVALHGPQPATQESASLEKEAIQRYESKYGERYYTTLCTGNQV